MAIADRYAQACPCGYMTECVIHCGRGHETGQCPPLPEFDRAELDRLNDLRQGCQARMEDRMQSVVENWPEADARAAQDGSIKAFDEWATAIHGAWPELYRQMKARP